MLDSEIEAEVNRLPVSVVMPIRDGAATALLALNDLLAGMGPDDELLAIDDGSRDSTPAVLADCSSRDSRLRVVSTPGLGLVKALNLGIREATHAWVARADADDRYPTSRLTLQRDAVDRDVVLVTGDYRAMSRQGPPTYIPCALGHPFVALSLINPQRIPHPGVLLRRSAILAAGGYQDADFPAEDLGLWLRLSEHGVFVGVPGVVVDWTMATGSVSHTRQIEQRSRTKKLLDSWRPTLLDLVDEESVSRELASYESTAYARERALLLLRDTRAWHRSGKQVPGQAQILKSSARHPVSSLKAGWRLAREARQRRRARREVVASLE